MAGVRGVPPTGVNAVAMNITATSATTASYATVWPSGESLPVASNLNFRAQQTVPNFAIAKLGADGGLHVAVGSGSSDIIFDVVGYFVATGGMSFTPVTPFRITDSRIGTDRFPGARRT